MKATERRDPKAVTAFFQRRDEWRRRLLSSDAARKNPRLFALGYVLSERFDWTSFDCFPERDTIADEIGISPTQVSTLTKELAAHGFIKIKRRRNASSFYVGTNPQDVKSSSHPESFESERNNGLDVKSSPLRKSSAVHFRKSSGLAPNVIKNVIKNVGGGAPAPAAYIDLQFNNYEDADLCDVRNETAPSFAPDGASGASDHAANCLPPEVATETGHPIDENEFVTVPVDTTLDDFVEELVGEIVLPPGLIRRLRCLLETGTLTKIKLHQIRKLGEQVHAKAK